MDGYFFSAAMTTTRTTTITPTRTTTATSVEMLPAYVLSLHIYTAAI